MKNKILKTITYAAVIIWLLGAMAADNESMVPIYMLFISEAWLIPFTLINRR